MSWAKPSQAVAEMAVKAWFAGRLRDPESAHYTFLEPVTAVLGAGGTRLGPSVYMCGIVNARNGFGGYTGRVNFQVILFRDKVLTGQVADEAHRHILEWCNEAYRDQIVSAKPKDASHS